MASKTSIEWTDYNWNFLRGCSRVSEGCRNCYAEGVAARFSGAGMAYEGLAKFVDHKPRWTGEISFHEDILLQPLRWKTPRKVFVNSMSDLFHEKVTDEMLDKAFAVMALTPQHTYQILTKRPERMKQFIWKLCRHGILNMESSKLMQTEIRTGECVPLSNVWLGVSVEDQKTADERIPLLLDTVAAKRWISAEPLLGPINVEQYLYTRYLHGGPYHEYERLDWGVVGGESGPSARECDSLWVAQVVKQFREAAIPVFVKQLGGNVWGRNDDGFDGDFGDVWPADTEVDDWHLDPSRQYQGAPCRVMLRNRKGGDMNEWPKSLRVREFPA